MNITDKEELRIQFSNASQLTMRIQEDGSMENNYKDLDFYKKANLIGDVYGFSTGNNKIHRVYVGTTKDEIVIAVKGTEGPSDWVNNFHADLVDFYGMGKVHEGFYKAATALIEAGILEKVETLLQANPQLGICLTGHSKGGAVATLLAARMQNYKVKKRVVIFEAPRVGDLSFAEKYKGLNIDTYRYEDFNDLITHIPFTSQEFTLLGRMGVCDQIIKNLIDEFTDPCVSVGERIGFFVKYEDYNAEYPHNEGNKINESLNSMMAIEYYYRKNRFPVGIIFNKLTYIHNTGYCADKVDYVDC